MTLPTAPTLPSARRPPQGLTVVIPVFNERRYIVDILRQVLAQRVPTPLRWREVIVVDDGSTDGTRDILRAFRHRQVRVFFHERNRGKGAALRTAFGHARGDIIIIQDADLEYDPAEYGRLLAPILNGRADIVYGTRFLGSESHRVLYFWHRLGNGALTLLSNLFTDLNLSDMETCYKVFRADILRRIEIEENRFGFEPEVTAKIAVLAKHADIRIYEVGISYHGRTYREGKKIGLKDAFRTFWCIWKYNTDGFAAITKFLTHETFLTLLPALLVSGMARQGFPLLRSVLLTTALLFLPAFTLHDRLTWRRNRRMFRRGIVPLLSKFAAVYLLGTVLRTAGLLLSSRHVPTSSALGVSSVVLWPLLFVAYSRWVFAYPETGEDHP